MPGSKHDMWATNLVGYLFLFSLLQIGLLVAQLVKNPLQIRKLRYVEKSLTGLQGRGSQDLRSRVRPRPCSFFIFNFFKFSFCCFLKKHFLLFVLLFILKTVKFHFSFLVKTHVLNFSALQLPEGCCL